MNTWFSWVSQYLCGIYVESLSKLLIFTTIFILSMITIYKLEKYSTPTLSASSGFAEYSRPLTLSVKGLYYIH